ncbi:MAG: hypothetical protein ACE14S_11475 [Candidatus Bathyarchaeia archaeon]
MRYAVPGFIFILIIVGLNYSPILAIVKDSGANDGLSIVLSFITLFSGSAIGFLISQVWFLYFNARKLDSTRINNNFEDAIQKTTGWIKKKWSKSMLWNDKEKERASAMAAIIDYLLLTEKNEEKVNFCKRKWDLYHSLSCTLVSLIMSAVLGVLLRGYAHCSFFESFWKWIIGGSFFGENLANVNKYCLDLLNQSLAIDYLLFGFTLVAVLFLSILIVFVRRQVFAEYYQMFRLFFTERRFDTDFRLTLRIALNDEYFEQQ